MQNLRVLSIPTRRPGPTPPPGQPCPSKIRRLVPADAPGYRALRERPDLEPDAIRVNGRSRGKWHFYPVVATFSVRPV